MLKTGLFEIVSNRYSFTLPFERHEVDRRLRHCGKALKQQAFHRAAGTRDPRPRSGSEYAIAGGMKKSRLALLALTFSLASWSVTHAETPDMPLRHGIGVSEVAGGGAENPRWQRGMGNEEFRRALENSLYLAGLLERSKGEGRYSLDAELESIESPDVGISLTVTARVRYTLRERATGRQVFRECVCGEYTIEAWDGVWRPKRLQVAGKGAALESAEELTRKLMHVSLPHEGVSLAR